MQWYAGIGSRDTPSYILDLMTRLASKLEETGYILRSGHCIGPDRAFEAGVVHSTHKEIFTAPDATAEAIAIAAEHHPYWEKCKPYVKKLHGRNAMIILGEYLDKPVKFVICYTPDGKNTGGTGLGMSIANTHNIPIYNLFYRTVRERVTKFIGNLEELDLL